VPTAISISNLTKVFGSGAAAAVAVDNISLDIQPGELFFLLGPSGCGKTTLLRMIAGFIEPTSGSIGFSSDDAAAVRDVTYLPPNKRNTGMVFQSYALWPHMTVEQNVAFGLDLRRIPADEKAQRIRQALTAVHMEVYAKRKPNQLSGGQQQRVALARALVIRPDVLLLDEPLSNLDAKLRIELRSEIRRICKEAADDGGGITTVYVTHDQKEALSMADRVAILDRGRIIQLGPPRDLYRRPASRFVAEFLGETNFLPATLISRRGDSAIIRTAAGDLESSAPAAAGNDLVCSIRPEAIRIGPPAASNTFSGILVETTYLGELAQHAVELSGGQRIKVADLNPGAARSGPVHLTVAPEDVVVLPGA
jgi:iron(III) transport system ATP-binding protein